MTNIILGVFLAHKTSTSIKNKPPVLENSIIVQFVKLQINYVLTFHELDRYYLIKIHVSGAAAPYALQTILNLKTIHLFYKFPTDLLGKPLNMYI